MVLKNVVEQEISKVLVGLGNPLFGKFKNSMIDKVILIHYAYTKKLNIPIIDWTPCRAILTPLKASETSLSFYPAAYKAF